MNDQRERQGNARGTRDLQYSVWIWIWIGLSVVFNMCTPGLQTGGIPIRGKHNSSGEKEKQGIRKGETSTFKEIFQGANIDFVDFQVKNPFIRHRSRGNSISYGSVQGKCNIAKLVQ